MNITEFMTWDTLATYAGALAMVLLLTQLTKSLNFIKKIPTQIWSYFLALIVLIPATLITQGVRMELVGLCLFNAVIISIAANGGYSAIEKFIMKKE